MNIEEKYPDIHKGDIISSTDGIVGAFRSWEKDDMGNLNILEIADYIKRKNNGGLYVYGTDVDGQIYVYRDISTYVKALKLYNDINYFIDEVVDNI